MAKKPRNRFGKRKRGKVTNSINIRLPFNPSSMQLLVNKPSKIEYPLIWNCKFCPKYLLTEKAARDHLQTCTMDYVV